MLFGVDLIGKLLVSLICLVVITTVTQQLKNLVLGDLHDLLLFGLAFARRRSAELLLGGVLDGLGAVLRAGLEVLGVLPSGLLGGVLDL